MKLFVLLTLVSTIEVFAIPSSDPLIKKNKNSLCDILNLSDINEFAKDIVLRKARKIPGDDEIRITKGEIVISFSDSIIESLLKTKNYFNAHQLKNLNKDDTYVSRIKSENALIEIDLNCKTDQEFRLRPKYAYFIPSLDDTNLKTTISNEYGNVFAVLKNDIKRRSTFTLSDSMDLKDKSKVFTFYSIFPKVKLIDLSNEYLEAQVWGDVKLSDVDYFLVNCSFSKKITLKEAINLEVKSGVPVHQCHTNTSHTHLKRGEHILSQTNYHTH